MQSSSQDQAVIVAGATSGVPVRCVPAVQPIYDNLQRLANGGNYWAGQVIGGLQSLSSGRLHLNNVFVNKNNAVAHGNGEFFVVLPGCKVTLEKLENGDVKIVHMQADTDFVQLQESGVRPGLFRANKELSWGAEPVADGQVLDKEDRIVCISDRGYESAKQAVADTAEFVSSVPFSGGGFKINSKGFDLHYTPGQGRIGGLRNMRQALHAENSTELNESALLLAKTMYKARDIEGVGWVSEFGGSGVLTQAMKILIDQGITLSSHAIYLHRPTTSQNNAYKLSQKLGLKVDRKIGKNNLLNINELAGGLRVGGQFLLPWQRYRSEEGYSLLQAGSDMVASGGNAKTAVNTAAVVGGAVAATAGVSAGVATAPALIAFLGAFTAVKGVAGVGSTLSEAWLPKQHAKIKSKF